jgi:hypothetical protein
MNGTYENSFYVEADGYKTLWELALGDGCRIESMYLTSCPLEHGGRCRGNNVSCSVVRCFMDLNFFGSIVFVQMNGKVKMTMVDVNLQVICSKLLHLSQSLKFFFVLGC